MTFSGAFAKCVENLRTHQSGFKERLGSSSIACSSVVRGHPGKLHLLILQILSDINSFSNAPKRFYQGLDVKTHACKPIILFDDHAMPCDMQIRVLLRLNRLNRPRTWWHKFLEAFEALCLHGSQSEPRGAEFIQKQTAAPKLALKMYQPLTMRKPASA